MKRLFLIGNNKMHFTKSEIVPYLKKLCAISKKTENNICIAVSAPYLYLAEKYLKKSKVAYGLQNCHYEKKGQFTGENSVTMLKDFAGTICIVGHSERRLYNHETDEEINLKLKSLLKENLKPIFCFGETREDREKDLTKKVIKTQLEIGLNDLTKDEVKKIYFAYEPVWAMGTGESATARQVEDMSKYIKQYICKMFDLTDGEIILLYGGSLNSDNAVEILSGQHIDGGLIGMASLDIDKFAELIRLEIKED